MTDQQCDDCGLPIPVCNMNAAIRRAVEACGPDALKSSPEVQALVAEAVAKERERIAVGLAATIGAIDHGCPSCVSTACDIFNGLETGWKLAMIEDEFGNEKYSDDNDRILVAAIRAGKGE